MISKIISGKASINGFDFIILHVGTNHLPLSVHSVSELMSLYNDLITVIKSKSKAKIIFSSVLPRPVDYGITREQIKQVNAALKQLCKTRNCQYSNTYRQFLQKGTDKEIPDRSLFAVKDGGLHLNLSGTHRLRQVFINIIKHLSVN